MGLRIYELVWRLDLTIKHLSPQSPKGTTYVEYLHESRLKTSEQIARNGSRVLKRRIVVPSSTTLSRFLMGLCT